MGQILNDFSSGFMSKDAQLGFEQSCSIHEALAIENENNTTLENYKMKRSS